MPFVKVPGFEREVWVDLHEPAPDTVPLVSDICTVVAMPTTSPDDWTVAPPTLTHSKSEHAEQLVANARAYQKSRTVRVRPFAYTFTRAEDFAVTVLYFESRGFSRSTKQASIYWIRHGHSCPTARQIEDALKVVRGWSIVDLEGAVQSIRKRYRLTGVVPTHKSVRFKGGSL